ncbi:hypothetical protein EV138_5649 [Kribbella voronezhensis]|uniref:Uncharacterized protein n=1 Tax=Kribbella voronezhensis TaxID=2512212 RepID=A0A4R7SXJ4_9ACTN|nr:hypothetical protein [Kribbella voronezhensis]TDU83187.1 hypothetical protein EV138_5649 [Kribbella voronezhensis]
MTTPDNERTPTSQAVDDDRTAYSGEANRSSDYAAEGDRAAYGNDDRLGDGDALNSSRDDRGDALGGAARDDSSRDDSSRDDALGNSSRDDSLGGDASRDDALDATPGSSGGGLGGPADNRGDDSYDRPTAGPVDDTVDSDRGLGDTNDQRGLDDTSANERGLGDISEQRGSAQSDNEPDVSPEDPLVPDDVVVDFRARWDVIQQGFVDDPRSAVTDADKLVGDVLQRLSNTFDKQHQSLEGQWADGEPSTEDLRGALQRYRAFFDRLLTL